MTDIGEINISVEYMKHQLDRIVSVLDKQQEDIDNIKIQMAELRGSHKILEWIRSIIAGLIGAVASILTILFTWGK